MCDLCVCVCACMRVCVTILSIVSDAISFSLNNVLKLYSYVKNILPSLFKKKKYLTFQIYFSNYIPSSSPKVVNSEDYFIANGKSKKITTSDHTLSHLKTSRLSADAMQSALSAVAPSHPEERLTLTQEHMALFPRWMTFLW